VAFVARANDGQNRIWIRPIDSLEATPLPGTESPNQPGVFWSPDSQFIGFASGDVLKKINVHGGPAISLGDVGPTAGASWNKQGVILVGSPRGVWRVSQADGNVERAAITVVLNWQAGLKK
jgi:hypothetical protein